MSNLSKGTGSRKDTKMRIRAFPEAAGWHTDVWPPSREGRLSPLAKRRGKLRLSSWEGKREVGGPAIYPPPAPSKEGSGES